MNDDVLAEVRRAVGADPARAERLAREILREEPTDPDALLLLAIALRRQNAFNPARAILEALADDRPELPQVHYELAVVLGHLGDNLGAMAGLGAAIDLDPNFAAAWEAMGDQMTRMRSKKGADAAYSKAFLLQVEDETLRNALQAQRAGNPKGARTQLLGFLDSHPDDITALKMLGEVELTLQHILRAEGLFRRCVELAPDFAAARLRYATVLMTQNKLREAIAQVDVLLEQNPDDRSYRNLKAAALLRMSAFDEAAKEYEATLKTFPNQPGAWLSYGHTLKAMGRRDDCVAAYRKAMSLLPGLGEPYWSLANLKTYRFKAAETDAMREQLARPDLKGDNRAQIFFALGRALEDTGHYEEAFHNYSQGNAIVRTLAPYDADETSEHVRRSKALFTRAFFDERRGSGAPARDPIFVVGLPRSGSTLIEQILASHSEVEGTTELRAITYLAGRLGGKLKPDDPAPHYPKVLADLDGAKLMGLGEEYLWRAATHRKLGRPFFIDKMPNNFGHVGLIHLILPNARIIDVRRHPLACGWSNYTQHFGTGQQFSYELSDIGRYYADYVELMAHFDRVLPGEVHRVFYEDLVANPDDEVRKLLAFLGLPFEEACLRPHESDRLVLTASAEQVRRPINRDGLGHWRHFEPWLGPLKAKLGYVLDRYPQVPEFYSRLHADLGYGWKTNDQHWSAGAAPAAGNT